ncbi:MAG: glucosylceramidase [Clostridia bacterium]|nr:glucosylceramidase [Clostridia bacterium]
MRQYHLFINGEAQSGGVFRPDSTERENGLIRLYPSQTDQVWEGFGGAVTDSAAYVFSLMQPEQQQELLDAYFGADGLGYTLLRVPIDSCDFSLEQYEAAPDGDPDRFDMERPLRYILPMLEAIRKRAPGITLMLSPWSPPKCFKTNGKRHGGGKCKPEHYAAWAEYICRYIREFEDRGFPVSRISLQNEPHASQTWDSCLWTAEEERAFLVGAMKPALVRNGFSGVQVYIWDHNKERVLERALEVLDDEGRRAADGIAFHWYSGDHFDALRRTHALFPEKKLLLSENCIEYSKFDLKDPVLPRNAIAHEILGDLECGTNAFFDWNMVLDSRGGPNYVKNYCHAPLLYNESEGVLRRQSTYDSLWHFARFIVPGSRRILTSSFTSEVETTAFARPDGAVALVLLNRGARRKAAVSLGGELAEITLPARSLVTLLIL